MAKSSFSKNKKEDRTEDIKIYKEKFKNRLEQLMEEQGIKKTNFKFLMGIDGETMNNYLNGDTLPNGTNIVKLSKHFNVSASYLLGETDVRKADNVENFKKFGINEEALKNLEQINSLNGKFDNKYLDMIERVITNPDLYANLLKQTEAILKTYSDDNFLGENNSVDNKINKIILEHNKKDIDKIVDILCCQKFLEVYHNYVDMKLIESSITNISRIYLEERLKMLEDEMKRTKKKLYTCKK